MKTLLLMRHAKSSWAEEGLPDHDRPLNGRGKRDAPRIGKLIRELDLIPDHMVSSTAKRARSTAKRVAEACGYTQDIEASEDLYGASTADWIGVLSRIEETNDRVLGIGHNPGIEEFLEKLIGDYEPMPTGALAQVALPIERWVELDLTTQGDLIGLWLPKELD